MVMAKAPPPFFFLTWRENHEWVGAPQTERFFFFPFMCALFADRSAQGLICGFLYADKYMGGLPLSVADSFGLADGDFLRGYDNSGQQKKGFLCPHLFGPLFQTSTHVPPFEQSKRLHIYLFSILSLL